jgi:lambda family phage minor tail protein L
MPHPLDADLAEALEGFDVGEVVELFQLDATDIGGEVYSFAPSPVIDADGDQAFPSFGGVVYSVLPFTREGFAWSGSGPLPTPRLTFSLAREDGDQASAATALLALLGPLDDLLGARVIRLRTLRQHLDDGDDPDADAHLGAEVYAVERKAAQTGDSVTFELRSALDHEGVTLPRRQALDRCQWRYRVANEAGDGFDYSRATCPYTGAGMFGLDGGAVAAPALDRCAKNLADCKLRFGAAAELPFGGFPGVGRIKGGT